MSYVYNELAISNSLHGGNKLNESGMDSEVDKVSGTSSGIETEAAKASPDSTEPLIQRRGSRRLVKTAVTSPSSGDFRSVSGATVRVLRARRAGASRTNESKNAPCKKKTTSLLRSRRSTGSRSKNTPHKQPAIKKSAAKKASKHALGRKLSTSRKGKGTLPTRASRTPPSTTCKAEAEMKNSSFVEETGALKGSSDNIADPDTAPDEDDPNDLIYEPQTKKDKSRRRTTLQKQDVKKEESEKEEEENNIKREESAEVVVQMDEGDNTEPPRKRGRQQNDDKAPRPSKRRKKPPVQYVRCEMEGCGTVLAHPRYLQHHIKYQHLLQKKYVCDHPSCGRLFRLQKQLLRHAKHHTDQRDYICEYCARAFKSSHNLAVHRMIHTGEKPIQCEICGFTCRQKASLNWHMKKHDAEASYQFSCSICGKKFEKKDSVVAHKAKSHPEVLIAEALAANGGSVISTPAISISETASVLTQPDQPSVSPVSNETQDSLDSQEAVSGTLAPLQQVVLPLTSHTQVDVSQGQFLHLPMHHMVQLAHPQQQQAPTMLNLTTATPAHMSSSSLLMLSSVTAQAVHWGRGAHVDPELSGEGQLWDRGVVGAGGGGRGHQEVEEMMWEREGERQILLHCAEVHGDSLI